MLLFQLVFTILQFINYTVCKDSMTFHSIQQKIPMP